MLKGEEEEQYLAAGAAVAAVDGPAATDEDNGWDAWVAGTVDCRFDWSDLLRTVFILDKSLLPTPFPFSSRPSAGVSTLEVMLM